MSEIPELSTDREHRRVGGPRQPKKGRSPVLAGLLSIIPGAGHAYLGLTPRGVGYFLLMAVMVLLIMWARVTHEFEVFPGMIEVLIAITAIFWIWMILNAIWLASRGRALVGALGMICVLSFTYLLGWQVTEVNLEKFFTEFSDTFNIFSRIMWPWETAMQRDQEVSISGAPFAVPCEDGEIPESSQDGSQWLVVEPGCGEFARYVLGEGVEPGTELTLSGAGYDPEKEVTIWMRDPIGGEFRPLVDRQPVSFMPEPDGTFTLTLPAPQYNLPGFAEGVQLFEVQARQVVAEGPLRVSDDLKLAGGRMVVTIFQAMMATSFGVVLAVPLSFLAAQNLMRGNVLTQFIYYAVRFVMNVTRSIEPLIWAIIATVWVGLGPFAGVIALTLHTVAALGKLYSEAIESIQPGPIEAITATGANRLQVIMYGIVPQIIPPFLSFTIYRWDINVRMSTIIGLVGGGGIGQVLFQWINQTRWSSAGMAVWLIAITVALMDYASAEFRKRFV